MIHVGSCSFCFSTSSMHMNLELRCNSLNWPSSALTYFFPAVYLKKRWAVWLVARLDGSFSAALVLFLRRRWAACENLSLRSVSCRTRERKKNIFRRPLVEFFYLTRSAGTVLRAAESWQCLRPVFMYPKLISKTGYCCMPTVMSNQHSFHAGTFS